MNELIQVEDRHIGDGTIQTVNARELHVFLGVGKDFSTWVNDRIQKYGFVEHHDFVTAQNLRPPASGSTKARAQIAIDYHITLDMAKELAMVERNDKGKQAPRARPASGSMTTSPASSRPKTSSSEIRTKPDRWASRPRMA